MRLTINQLTLNNFKGKACVTVRFNPDGSLVSGANGTGKTTLFDSWLWLLFDSDSAGHKGADAVKTTQGAVFAHFLTHSVTADVTLDGRAYQLKKVFEEKWVKKRGQEQQEMDGNTTKFWINDVPKSKTEYDAWISTLAPADYPLLMILSDPLFFSTGLHFATRLQILTALCGGLTAREVAGDDPGLNDMLDRMAEANILTIDDYKKMLNTKIREINDALPKIQSRIDERHRVLANGTDIDTIDATMLRDKLLDQVNKLDGEADSIKADILEPLRAKQSLYNKTYNDLNKAVTDLVHAGNAAVRDAFAKTDDFARRRKSLANTLKAKQDDMDNDKSTAIRLDKQMDALREEWKRLNEAKTARATAVMPEANVGATCMLCGQPLPEDHVIADHIKAVARFQKEQSDAITLIEQEMARITIQGSELKTRLAKVVADQAILEGEIQFTEEAQRKLEKEWDAHTDSMVTIKPATAESFDDHPLIVSLKAELDTLKAELDAPLAVNMDSFTERRTALRNEIARLDREIYSQGDRDSSKLRIEELTKELKDAAATKSMLEGQIYQAGRMTQARSEKLEIKINELFTSVSFKFFTEQINGGRNDACEAVVGQTTFSKANTAAQVNAGLEIISVIGRWANAYAPVFIDRLESINDLMEISAQQISLMVTRDQGLHVDGVAV